MNSSPAFVIDTDDVIAPGPTLDAIYAVAWALLNDERIDDATGAFRVMVRYAPTDERGWLGLGACHERRDQPEIAQELYGAGSTVAVPPSVRCHLALARKLRENGDDVAADEQIQIASELADTDGDAEMLALVEEEGRAA